MQQDRLSEGASHRALRTRAELTGGEKVGGLVGVFWAGELQEQRPRTGQSCRREKKDILKKRSAWLRQLQVRMGECMAVWGWKNRTRLACLKPTGTPGGSEEWREISQLAFKGLTLAAARVSVDQSCFGRCSIRMTSSFLAILSGNQGDLSKCAPDMQLKAPQQ